MPRSVAFSRSLIRALPVAIDGATQAALLACESGCGWSLWLTLIPRFLEGPNNSFRRPAPAGVIRIPHRSLEFGVRHDPVNSGFVWPFL
jgi:hypothetical protein